MAIWTQMGILTLACLLSLHVSEAMGELERWYYSISKAFTKRHCWIGHTQVWVHLGLISLNPNALTRSRSLSFNRQSHFLPASRKLCSRNWGLIMRKQWKKTRLNTVLHSSFTYPVWEMNASLYVLSGIPPKKQLVLNDCINLVIGLPGKHHGLILDTNYKRKINIKMPINIIIIYTFKMFALVYSFIHLQETLYPVVDLDPIPGGGSYSTLHYTPWMRHTHSLRTHSHLGAI